MADDVNFAKAVSFQKRGPVVDGIADENNLNDFKPDLESLVDQLLSDTRTRLLKYFATHIAHLEQENDRLRSAIGSGQLVSIPMKTRFGNPGGSNADEAKNYPRPLATSVQVRPCSGSPPDESPSIESGNAHAKILVGRDYARDKSNSLESVDYPEKESDKSTLVLSAKKDLATAKKIGLCVHTQFFREDPVDICLPKESIHVDRLRRGLTAKDDEIFYQTLKELNEKVNREGQDSAEGYEEEEDESTLHPMSVEVLTYDFFFLATLWFDFVRIPGQLLGYNREHGMNLTFDWICRLMWSLQLCRSAVTGYVKPDGTLEMKFPNILSNYIFGWFPFDFTFTVLQWLELALPDLEYWSDLKVLRIYHAAAMFRLVRIIQVVRVPSYMLPLTQLFFNEWAVLVFGIAKMMMLFLGLVHYVACGYYGLGVYLKNQGIASWVQYYDLENQSLYIRYVYAMHWSMTNILGEGEVMPASPWERAYTCLTLFVMFVSSSYVMSTITASLTQINNISEQHTMHLLRLRQFLSNMHISSALTARVLYCAKYVVKERERNLANNRELLSFMSEPLRLQVVHEAYVPTLNRHPFFKWLDDVDMPAMLDLADNHVINIPITVGDVVFAKGEEPADPSMLFVMRGSCLYLNRDEGVYVPEEQWCLEKVLWLERWVRVGTLRGASNCACLCVDAKGFRQLCLGFDNRAEVAREYARQYVDALQKKFVVGEQLDDMAEDLDVETFAKEAFKDFEHDRQSLKSLKSRSGSGSSGRLTMISQGSKGRPSRAGGGFAHSAVMRMLKSKRQSYRKTVKIAGPPGIKGIPSK